MTNEREFDFWETHEAPTVAVCANCKAPDSYLNDVWTDDGEKLSLFLDEEPECTCSQTDVDMFDPRGCEYHDWQSAWNVHLRALTAWQQFSEMEGTTL